MEKTGTIQKEMPQWGWWILIGYMIAVGFLAPDEINSWAFAAGWFAFGIACLLNFKSCGRVHCSITGPGFIGLGILTSLIALGFLSIPEWIVWASFAGIMILGYGLEFREKKLSGSCYRC